MSYAVIVMLNAVCCPTEDGEVMVKWSSWAVVTVKVAKADTAAYEPVMV